MPIDLCGIVVGYASGERGKHNPWSRCCRCHDSSRCHCCPLSFACQASARSSMRMAEAEGSGCCAVKLNLHVQCCAAYHCHKPFWQLPESSTKTACTFWDHVPFNQPSKKSEDCLTGSSTATCPADKHCGFDTSYQVSTAQSELVMLRIHITTQLQTYSCAHNPAQHHVLHKC